MQYVTTDMITFNQLIRTQFTKQVKRQCDIGSHQYRILCCLKDVPSYTPTQLAEKLGLSKGAITQNIKVLLDKGYIKKSKKQNSGSFTVDIALAGLVVVERADEVLNSVYDDIYAPLDQQEIAFLNTGSLLTNQLYGLVRMTQEDFNYTYASLEAVFASEQKLKETTHLYALSLVEFRLLFALFEAKLPIRPKDLATTLLVESTYIAYTINELTLKGYVREERVKFDRRSKTFVLTAKGTLLIETLFPKIEQWYLEGVRHLHKSERIIYREAAQKIVEEARRKHGKR